MDLDKQIAALEFARSEASAKIFAERAATGNALVTLRNLKSAALLNGTHATIIANSVAPHKPSAGRMAVRLADDTVIAVKFENALPTVAAGTRVAVNPELAMCKEGGFLLEADLGVVAEWIDGGGSCRVKIDSVYGKPKSALRERDVVVALWKTGAADTLVLEEPFLRQAATISTAARIDAKAAATRRAATAEARQAGKAELRSAADAARRWRQLENHAHCRSLAALNELGALRQLINCHLAEHQGQPAKEVGAEAFALLGDRHLFASFPPQIIGRFYCECANLYLQKAQCVLGYPLLRAAGDTHDLVMMDLNSARQYAEELKDDALKFMVLNQVVVCLITFHQPTDRIKTADATHLASDYGRGMLDELSMADRTLAKHSERAAAGEAPFAHHSAGHYERHRTDLSFARSKLVGWLDERQQQKASVAVTIPAPAMVARSEASYEDEACIECD